MRMFFGIGGYVVGILYAHARSGSPIFGFIPGAGDMAITLPAALVIGALLALITGAISLRTSGVQFIMITLAFAQMFFYLFVSLKAYGGDDGLSTCAAATNFRPRPARRRELLLVLPRDCSALVLADGAR